MQIRKAVSLGYLMFGIFFICIWQSEAANQFLIAPPETWVNVQNITASYSATNSSDKGVRFILIDNQVNVPLKEHYRRLVKKIISEGGVQDNGQLNLNYDPSYEELIIHNVYIRRGTNILNRLQQDKIKIIQQERDLDM